MSFWTYLPLIKMGIKVIVCTSQCMAARKREQEELSFWDWLECLGSCVIDYTDDIQPPQTSEVKKKTGKTTLPK